MFTTVSNVKQYTNRDVTLDLIMRAQALVEILIGRSEIDVENPSDLIVLDKMTAYQAVYMIENEELIYKQIGTGSIGSGDSFQSFNTAMLAPYIAPLTMIAKNGLSFNKSKSYKTGKIFQWNRKVDWRTL
jgi:hypothetical protein